MASSPSARFIAPSSKIFGLALVALAAALLASPTALGAEFKPGDKVMIQWEGDWYPGAVLTVNPGGGYRISYDEYGSDWDEDVTPSRVRSRSEKTDTTDTQFHAIIRKKNPSYPNTGKFTMAGDKIVAASLSRAEISNLTFLSELPLDNASVVLAVNPLEDLTGLADANIKELTLAAGFGELESLSPLAGMELEMLDVNGNSMLRDISGLKGMPLKKLSMHNAPVTDLTPLAGMELEELRLSPRWVQRGWDVVRKMKSLKILSDDWPPDTTPEEFFRKLDSGEFGPPINLTEFDSEAMSVAADVPEPPRTAPEPDQVDLPNESSSSQFTKGDKSKWALKETALGPLAERSMGTGSLGYSVRDVYGIGYFASPNQLRYATVSAERLPGQTEDGLAYRVDGKRVGPVVTVYSHGFRFSRDSKRFGWIGAVPGKKPNEESMYVFVDGEQLTGPRVEYITEFNFSRDGKLAWTGQESSSDPGADDLFKVWIDGKPVSSRYTAIRDLTFSPDGTSVAWWGWDPKRTASFLSVNGKEVSTDTPCSLGIRNYFIRGSKQVPVRRWIRFGPGGDLAYEVGMGEDTFVMHDGSKGPRIKKAGPIVFSPDGKHMGYRGIRSDYGDECVVIDGKVVAEGQLAGTPCFSPDSQHHAFLLRDKSTGRMHLMIDGEKKARISGEDLVFPFGDGHGDQAGNIVFSPDSQHAVCVYQTFEYVEIHRDDKKIDEFTAKNPSGTRHAESQFCPHSLAFSPDGKHLAFGLECGEVWIDGQRLAYDHLPRGFRIIWDDNDRLHFQAAKDGKAMLMLVSLSGEPDSWDIGPAVEAITKTDIDMSGAERADEPKLQEGDVPIPGTKIVGTYTSVGSEASTVYELAGVRFCVVPKEWQSRPPDYPPHLMLLGTTFADDTMLEICRCWADHRTNGAIATLSYFQIPQRDSKYISWVRQGLKTYLEWKQVAIENNVQQINKDMPKYNQTREPEGQFVGRTPAMLRFAARDAGEGMEYTLYCDRPHPSGREGQMQYKPVVQEIAEGNGAESILAVLDNLDAFVDVHKYLVDIQTGKGKQLDSMFRVSGDDKADAPASLRAAASRTWTSGSNTIDATFVGFAGDKVRLHKADGKIVTVPSTILSKADQEYLKSLRIGSADKSAKPATSEKPEIVPREWTSGKYTVTASFAAVIGDNVRLRKMDGETVTVPIKMLSAADQEYLDLFR